MNKPFDKPDYAKFAQLGKVLKTASGLEKNLTAFSLDADSQERWDLETELEKIGFRRLNNSNMKKGSYAIVIEGNDQQMLRIVHKQRMYPTEIAHIMKLACEDHVAGQRFCETVRDAGDLYAFLRDGEPLGR